MQGNVLEHESLLSGIFLATYIRGQVFRGDEQLDFLKTLTEEAGHSKPQTLSNLFKHASGTHNLRLLPSCLKIKAA